MSAALQQQSVSASDAREGDSSASPAGMLQDLICSTESSVVRAGRFFVSWSGVLTLAYQGFSPALEALKGAISQKLPSLPRENPGSMWPKTSLGCLKEGARLTPEQLQQLLRICREESRVFENQSESSYDTAVMVDSLSAVTYECRCLERRLLCQRLRLLPDLSFRGPTEAEQSRVAAVMAETDAPNYWYHASRDGNRENHYRGTTLGATLVHDLSCFGSNESEWAASIPGIVQSFRQRVDRELPGLYTWFADASLHITVRALLG